jgi:hypothetical protein
MVVRTPWLTQGDGRPPAGSSTRWYARSAAIRAHAIDIVAAFTGVPHGMAVAQ